MGFHRFFNDSIHDVQDLQSRAVLAYLRLHRSFHHPLACQKLHLLCDGAGVHPLYARVAEWCCGIHGIASASVVLCDSHSGHFVVGTCALQGIIDSTCRLWPRGTPIRRRDDGVLGAVEASFIVA
jgi:hypothetical protein